jgi:hypothetical protein
MINRVYGSDSDLDWMIGFIGHFFKITLNRGNLNEPTQ